MEPINPRTVFLNQTEVTEQPVPLEKVNLFIFLTLILVIGSGIFFKEQILLGSSVMESLILLLTFGWIKIQGLNLRSTLQLKVPSFKEIGITLILTATGIVIASFFDQLCRFFLQNLGTIPESNIPQPKGIPDLLGSIAAIAILPALAEEAMFRGYVLKSYQNILPTGKAILISSILFGMAHLSISHFWGPFILGLLCGWLVCKFHSIYLAILAHVLNNTLTMTVFYFTPDLMDSKPIFIQDILGALPTFMMAGLIFLCLLLCLKPVLPMEQANKNSMFSIFKHWSTWIIFSIYGLFLVLEILVMRGIYFG